MRVCRCGVCVSLQVMNIMTSSNAMNTLSGGRFKNAYQLLNLRAPKMSVLGKNCIFQCMGKIFCVEFQRYPLKFHTKYLIHTLKALKDVYFIQRWKFKSHPSSLPCPYRISIMKIRRSHVSYITDLVYPYILGLLHGHCSSASINV